MQLEHTFTVPAGIDEAWKVLLDIERIAPCMPGAALDSVDGDSFTGTVKVKLGPIGLTYKGKASFVEKDEAAHRAVIDAQGKDSRGNGTASATITATLAEDGTGTAVSVTTDLNITGKPAQFGRGVMVDVGNKLIGQFADCLAGKLSGEADLADLAAPAAATPAAADGAVSDSTTTTAGAAPVVGQHAEPADTPAAAAPAVAPAPAAAKPAYRPAADVEPIDLLGSAGPAVLKRLAPVGVGLGLLVLVLLLVRRRQAD